MEKCFQHRAGVLRPIPVVLNLELLPGTGGKDLFEQAVHFRPMRSNRLEQVNDRSGLSLWMVYLERPVIKSVNGILIAPV